MNDDKYTIESGHLDVGDGHKIYYQRWGNPKKTPIFMLHGGPGGGTKDRYKLNFDPIRHHVIFHDQRGSGQSTPFASTKNNTTQDLVSDIEKLREYFKFETIWLTGGSWGSFLSLTYAVEHYMRVGKIYISGIFTGTRKELDYIQQGGLKTHYPDAWDQYVELVPDSAKKNTAKYYLDKMLHGTADERREYVRRWCLLESSAMSIDSDFEKDVMDSKLDDTSYEKIKALAIIEAHYFVNYCFVPEGYIQKNAGKLKDIDIVMTHGRFDHVCPPQAAYELANSLGKRCHLQIVPASHAREGALREVMRAYTWSFLA